MSETSEFAAYANVDPLDESDNEPLTKPKVQPKPKTIDAVKTRKPKTAAQMASFQKTAEIRRNNIEARKQEALIKSAELLVATNSKAIASKKVIPVAQEPELSESEDEIIIVKAKPKPKKKITRIIIEDSDDSDSTEDGVAPIRQERVRQERVSVQRRQQAQSTMQRAPNYFF